MRPVPDTEVFSRADVRALGWTDSAISRALRAGRLAQVRRGQLRLPGVVDDRVAAIAAVSARAGSVISHRSALLMHGLPIVGPGPPLPELTVSPVGSGSAPAAHLHRATLFLVDVVCIDGAPVTSVARTLIDVGRQRPTMVAVAAIDAALNRGLVSLDELDEVARRCWNWPGIGRALQAVRLSDGRAESPLESVSRLVLRWLRLPTPELQTIALDRDGRHAGRLDFYWEEWGVAGEADGRSKYDGREVLTDEKERQERLEDHNLVVVRWGWGEAQYRRPRLKARVEAAFERGRARDRSGLPRLWSVKRTKPAVRREGLTSGDHSEGKVLNATAAVSGRPGGRGAGRPGRDG